MSHIYSLETVRGSRIDLLHLVDYSRTPLIQSTMGQKKLAILSGDQINEGLAGRQKKQP